MQESVSDDLIQFGIDLGFSFFFFGVAFVLVSCIMDCYKNDDNHDHGHGVSDEHVSITIMEGVGVKPSVLRSIPAVDFNSKDFKDGVECVICLSDLVDGDKAKLLPSCNHWFHAGCIDSWFRSHSTCPICRKRVGSMQRGTRPEHMVATTVWPRTTIRVPTTVARFPTDHHASTNAAVVEHPNSGEAEQIDG